MPASPVRCGLEDRGAAAWPLTQLADSLVPRPHLLGVGWYALVTEPGSHALAEFETLLANDCGGPAHELPSPFGNLVLRSADSAGDQTRVGVEVLVGLHVDENRAFGCAD